jgi:hypothetical protein
VVDNHIPPPAMQHSSKSCSHSEEMLAQDPGKFLREHIYMNTKNEESDEFGCFHGSEN